MDDERILLSDVEQWFLSNCRDVIRTYSKMSERFFFQLETYSAKTLYEKTLSLIDESARVYVRPLEVILRWEANKTKSHYNTVIMEIFDVDNGAMFRSFDDYQREEAIEILKTLPLEKVYFVSIIPDGKVGIC